MKKILLLISGTLLAFPMIASATGLVGECVNCHTMHNSEQGFSVIDAEGTVLTRNSTPNQNLLRYDCIGCHAMDPTGSNIQMISGTEIPQVYHADPNGDLAAGNFSYIAGAGEGAANNDRKGHNIVDFFAADVLNAYSAPGDMRGHNFAGRVIPADAVNGQAYSLNTGFTCAGAVGCHGTRSQLLSSSRNGTDSENTIQINVKRQGIAAVTGSHHNSYDGAKDPGQMELGVHDGQKIADSYRFIGGLKGYGNEVDRWQNVDAGSHNEYYGDDSTIARLSGTSDCNKCHIPQGAARMAFTSTLGVPNQSMSGFCITCHGTFHSAGGGYDVTVNNGVSGAFLRHPSDYVIPVRGEYAAYTTYDITAPVARPSVYTTASATVTPGTDMVMCLSCHQPHATEHDGMLRFDYGTMIAGNFADVAAAQEAGGCMACHTTKGVLPGPGGVR